MSKENLAWFEFLLNPALIDDHLSQSTPDPSAVSLIVQFIYNGMKRAENLHIESDVFDTSVKGISEKKKHILAIVPLKIASFLDWNIDYFQQTLPLHIQNALFLLLLENTLEPEFRDPVSHSHLDLGLLLPHQLFSVALYHRWALSALIKSKLPLKVPKVSNIPIPGQQDPMLETREVQEGILSLLETYVDHSLRILEQLLTAGEIKSITKSALSVVPSTDGSSHDWSYCKHIPDEEFKCQIHYDLGIYRFTNYTSKESVSDAFYYFGEALSFLKEISPSPSYCHLKKSRMQALYDSCANICGRATPLQKRNLYDRYMYSVAHGFENLIEILTEDNLQKKIPSYIRQSLQLDLTMNEEAPEGLLFQVQTMNILKDAFEGRISDCGYFLHLLQAGSLGSQFFVENVSSCIPQLNKEQRLQLTDFLLCLMSCSGVKDLLSPLFVGRSHIEGLFSEEELQNIFGSKEEATDTQYELALGADLTNINDLNWVLIQSYDIKVLKQCCQAYLEAQKQQNVSQKPIWELNSKWADILPIPSRNRNLISNAIPEPARSICLLLIVKSQELISTKNFDKSLELLNEVFNIMSAMRDSDLRPSTMISWLLLVGEIQQQIHNLPCVEEAEVRKLAIRAKQCLSIASSRDRLFPWVYVTSWCKILLLNAQEWSTICSLNLPGDSPIQLLIKPLATVAQCLIDKTVNKVPWQDFFDLSTSILCSGLGSKREHVGSSSERHRMSADSQYSVFLELLQSVREPNCLSILISVFGHIFNILCDDVMNHVHLCHASYWPIKYLGQNCLTFVQEVLCVVLDHATELYPLGSHINTSTCASWFLTKADLAFYQEKHHKAIQNYLTAIFVATDYLRNDANNPEQNSMTETVLKRMIECCKCLGSYTQAAILCQFLPTIDYNSALQCLQERNAIDAMDACYNCLWDVTLIEFIINMHQKRGEFQRRDKVMAIMGLLEINSNNNEEIQREAAKVRKHRFLRALAKQYL